MPPFKDLAENMLSIFDAKDRAREESLKLSREVIRFCSSAIRSIHRGELTEAERLMDKAGEALRRVQEQLKDHQDIRYAGFVDGAEQEYAEARSVYSITTAQRILTPEEIGVDPVNYLGGLGDTTGELRRHILNLIRDGKPKEGEIFLDIMEEIYHLLMLFDYPDAVTRGLRRKGDLARSMLERTRGDLTNAIEMGKVEASLRALEDKLKDADFQESEL
jgi:translin